MKKRMIITNSIIVFLSLFIMLVISIAIIMVTDNNVTQKQAKNYLSLACSEYDGTNEEETVETLKIIDETLRITIIDLDGNVIIDSNLENIEDSHLDREEITNLGKICTRYSKTLRCNMLYIAALDDGAYVRISFPTDSINVVTTTFLGVGIVSLIIILAISIMLITYFSKKSLEPVNAIVNDLAHLTDNSADFTAISIDDLPRILEILRYALDDKIKLISRQKEQLIDVINYINNGLIVIDSYEKIKVINQAALDIFHVLYDAVIKKGYLYLIRDTGLQEIIAKSLNNKEDNEYTLYLDSEVYLVNIKYITASWINSGLIIMLQNITQSIELEKTKKEFFANASHELKSPLTCIIGYQQMITEKIETDPNVIMDYSNKTLKEANRMNDIIIDMLNLSKFERKEAMNIEYVEVNKLVEDVIDTFIPKLKEKNIEVTKEIKEVSLMVDRSHLDELVRNIIDNAIKYNNMNGSIHIELNSEYLSVKDTGIGIPLEDQKHVFERFYRVDKAKSKTLGGTGLGLAIVKHICEIYDFKIELVSSLSNGTEIKIRFK